MAIYFDDVGIFGGDPESVRVIDDKGKWGKANDRVIEELMKRNASWWRVAASSMTTPTSMAFEKAGDLPQHAAMVHRH